MTWKGCTSWSWSTLDGETLAERLARGGARKSASSGPAAPTPYQTAHEEAGGPSGAIPQTRRPLPLPEILSIATELASALTAAHKAGIVHRDLKPGNVMLTRSGVKVLDFGVAKLRESRAEPGQIEPQTTTNSEPVTAVGALVGTIPYMAPEQVEGRVVDTRSDIFALGSILYEMAAGRRAFGADSQSGVMAAILEHDPPPIPAIEARDPIALDRLIRACLAKDPDDRIQDARDLLWQLRWISDRENTTLPQATGGSLRLRRIRAAQLATATTLAILGMIAGYVAGRQRPATGASSPMTRFQIAVGAPVGDVSVSPNGRMIAYVAKQGGIPAIWVRSLDRVQSEKLPGTESTAGGLFWSPVAVPRVRRRRQTAQDRSRWRRAA